MYCISQRSKINFFGPVVRYQLKKVICKRKKIEYSLILVETCRWSTILENFHEFGATADPGCLRGRGEKKKGNKAQKVVISHFTEQIGRAHV